MSAPISAVNPRRLMTEVGGGGYRLDGTFQQGEIRRCDICKVAPAGLDSKATSGSHTYEPAVPQRWPKGGSRLGRRSPPQMVSPSRTLLGDLV